MSIAGVQTLGADLSLDVAREADALGCESVWVAEANAAEAMSLLGAISQAAPHVGLGTGVVALQLRTPPLHAMAAATLQQLAGDRAGVPRHRHLVACGRGSMARRGLHRPADRAGTRVRRRCCASASRVKR